MRHNKKRTTNIAIFASGNGTNFTAIARAVRNRYIKAKLALLICDNPQACVVKRAKRWKVKTLIINPWLFTAKRYFEEDIVLHLRKEKIDFVVLAGYMRLLSPTFVARYRNRILNIHPALLPAFKGLAAIKKAHDYGCKIAGVTVHFVDEQTDHGPIILQAAAEIKEGMGVDELEKKIHALEHKLYPRVVKLLVEGKLKVKGRKVVVLKQA